MILKTLFLVTAMVFSSSAIAETIQPLLLATTDITREECQLSIVLNDEGIATAIQYSAPTMSETFPIEGLKQGIVLFRYTGRDVMTLQSDRFDVTSGGAMTLTFLYNRLTDKYKSIPVVIERTSTYWEFQTDDPSGRRGVSMAYFKANRVLDQIVGISTIIFNSGPF